MTNLRRSKRRTVLWRATLHVAGTQHAVWVRDIGAGGAAVQGEIPLAIASAVVLDIDTHGAFHGFVVWSSGKLHGLAFADSAETVISRFASNAISLGMVEAV